MNAVFCNSRLAEVFHLQVSSSPKGLLLLGRNVLSYVRKNYRHEQLPELQVNP
jgi:hypothetical protein